MLWDLWDDWRLNGRDDLRLVDHVLDLCLLRLGDAVLSESSLQETRVLHIYDITDVEALKQSINLEHDFILDIRAISNCKVIDLSEDLQNGLNPGVLELEDAWLWALFEYPWNEGHHIPHLLWLEPFNKQLLDIQLLRINGPVACNCQKAKEGT